MAKPKTDHSRAHISSVRGGKSAKPSGSESSAANGPKGMAKKKRGKRVIVPGGRKTYTNDGRPA